MTASTRLTRDLGIELPIIGGAMYPCSNPELVAAVSAAGGIGVLQPVSLTYVHGHEFRAGVRYICSLTDRPVGMNVLLESSSRMYRNRMTQWLDVALEEGVRFFVTSLGKPDWVVRRVEQVGGRVYHDVTERKWADKRRRRRAWPDRRQRPRRRPCRTEGCRRALRRARTARPACRLRRRRGSAAGLRPRIAHRVRRRADRDAADRHDGMHGQRRVQGRHHRRR
jgi:hypothetical protein